MAIKANVQFRNFRRGALLACAVWLLARGAVAEITADITIHADKPTVTLPQSLYGIFFEDINYAADGGLYAELVQNRSFEYHPIKGNEKAKLEPMQAWDTIAHGGATVTAKVTSMRPLNRNNTHYLELKIANGEAGVRNSGYWGIPLDQGAKYDFSVFARTANWHGDKTLQVVLETQSGEVLGSLELKGVGDTWKKFEGVLVSSKKENQGRLVLTTRGQGTLDLDMVSLFPQDTFMGRKNGLRKDLALALKALHPKFLRFPGGCITHGDSVANMYRWKDSVGPVEQRKPNYNLWGYHQTYGLGFYEYFQFCEDLGMEALPVVPVGVACGFRSQECVPMEGLEPYIQDAVDLIEFANGPATSHWGAVRASMGHPAPFNLKYICLGNEEHDTARLRERYPLFVKAVKDKHPEIRIIGTSGLGWQTPLYGLMDEEKVYSSDEHYYEGPEWFMRHADRFDNLERTGPKIFVGEYASWGNQLRNAVAEAAYLTGIERNADKVDMACYAPLFARMDVDGWRPDLIYFNNRQVTFSTNYYVQQLFASNKGDVFLSNDLKVEHAPQAKTVAGSVGVGTWASAMEVKDLAVNGKKQDPSAWVPSKGKFEEQAGLYIQSDLDAKPAMSVGSELFSGKQVTYTLRARKTGGAEGFLIRFGADKEGKGGYWWNIGGWGNTKYTLQEFNGDSFTNVLETNGSIETGKWYDIKVLMSPGRIQCFLNGSQIHDYQYSPKPFFLSSTLDRATGEIIVKLVNPNSEPVKATVHLAGVSKVAQDATLISLAGDGAAENEFGKPEKIRPETSSIRVGSVFTRKIPATSVQFIRLKLP